MTAKTTEGTASLDKALDVLDAVASAPNGLSQAALAERLQLPRTTLYRLLGTLVERRLLRRDPQRRVYAMGMRCFEYAREAYAMPDLVAAASAELRALRDLTGETTYLAVLEGLEVLSLERCDGAHSQRSSAALGQRKPLHCTSQGKAILSVLPDTQRDALVKDMTLTPLTQYTITDRRRLQAELKVTAARGYSIDDEEIVIGVRCCGAPIVDAAGLVRGAISVAAPAFRLTMERVELLGPEMAQAARRIGAQLSTAVTPVAAGPVQIVPGDWAFHGAHPQWSASKQCLYWADTLAPSLHQADAEGDRGIARLESPIEAMLLLPDDTLLALQPEGWVELHANGRITPSKRQLPRRPHACVVAPGGAVWACVADGERFRVGKVEADGTCQGGWMLPEPVCALAWDSEGCVLYGIEKSTGIVLLMQPGTAAVRRFASMPKGSGRPTALAVDAQGGVWTAMRDGWSVVRWTTDGALDRVVGLPIPYPSGLAVGGKDGMRLYVTSDRRSLPIETLANAPAAGRLFVIDLLRAADTA